MIFLLYNSAKHVQCPALFLYCEPGAAARIGDYMAVNESAENYLETILILSKQLPVVRSVDIAKFIGNINGANNRELSAQDQDRL